MYSNNDNKNVSIQTRLTVFYSVSAFLLLTAASLFIYWGSNNILHKADYEFLSDEVDNIQHILHQQSYDKAALHHEVVHTPTSPTASIYRYYVRVFDQNNKLLVETPETNSILPATNAIANKSKNLNKKRYWWYTKNDVNFLFIQAPIQLGKDQKPGVIQIALDMSYQHEIVNDRKEILFTLLVGFIFALLLGNFIARRGVRSLTALTEAAEKITVNSLHERINPSDWPKELIKLGNAINRMLDRVENSYGQLKRFSADLAHELRTPVNNLTGEIETLLSKPRSHEEYQMVLESNLEELQRITQLIENILFLARTENPQYTLEKTSLDVRKEIDQICDYYQAMAEEKKITITCKGDATIVANRTMFQRAISNLLSNAICYTNPQGAIHITIRKLSEHLVQIQIQDNGIGIAASHLPHLFDRFYRVDESRTTRTNGAGLGLAMTKSIIELHHGSITINSQPAQGTTVSVNLPK